MRIAHKSEGGEEHGDGPERELQGGWMCSYLKVILAVFDCLCCSCDWFGSEAVNREPPMRRTAQGSCPFRRQARDAIFLPDTGVVLVVYTRGLGGERTAS